MANLKTSPDVDIWCYPLVSQTRYRGRSVALSDNLAELQRGSDEDAGYTGMGRADDSLMPSSGASQGGHVEDVDGLAWLSVRDEEDGTGLAGYTVAPRRVPLSSIVDGDDSINPPEETVGLVWKPSGDTADYWQTCIPDREPLQSAVKFSSTNMLDRASAQTALSLPENQEFEVELQLMGSAKSGDSGLQPWVRLGWGGRHMMQFTAGQSPMFGRAKNPIEDGARDAIDDINVGDVIDSIDDIWDTVAEAVAENGGAQTDYDPLRRVDHLGGFWNYDPITFAARYVGGRLLIDSPNGSTLYTNRARNQNPSRPSEYDDEGKVQAVTGRQAPLQVDARGCAFTLRVREMAYADTELTEDDDGNTIAAAVEDSHSGSFRRKFYTSCAPGEPESYAVGHWGKKMDVGLEQPPNTIAEVELEGDGRQAGENHYKCELKADAPEKSVSGVGWREDVVSYDENAMRGHSSPFVHAVVLNTEVQWRAVTTDDPVNIRPAVLRANETVADPSVQAGPSWDLKVQRKILRDLEHPSGGTLGTDWTDYIGRYHQIRINAGWVYDDGVTRAYIGDTLAGEKIGRLQGYQVTKSPQAPGYAEEILDLQARDPSVRLQPPAATIDSKYAALDFLMAQKVMHSGPDYKSELYGADCVQYIVDTALGDEWNAGDLQVYYPGYVGRWPAPAGADINHWSLMDYTLYTRPPSGGGLIWPPPFGSSAGEWIKQICDADFGVFFWAPDWDDPTQLAPCYGNYFVFLNYQDRPTLRVSDRDALPGDENIAVSSANWNQVADQDYNRMVVWGQAPQGGNMQGLMPALPAFSAAYTIENSPLDEQNAHTTWERTKVMKGTEFYLPGVARQVARLSAWLLWGIDVRRVSVTTRGIESVWWGDKFQVDAAGAESDPEMNFRQPDGSLQTFRAMRVNNTYDFTANTWQTQLTGADQPVLNPYD